MALSSDANERAAGLGTHRSGAIQDPVRVAAADADRAVAGIDERCRGYAISASGLTAYASPGVGGSSGVYPARSRGWRPGREIRLFSVGSSGLSALERASAGGEAEGAHGEQESAMSTGFSDEVRHLASAPVVVGVDGSEAADAPVVWAAVTAADRGRDLRIVHGIDLKALRRIFEPYDALEPPVLDALRVRGHELVNRCAQRARDAAPGLRVDTEVSESDAIGLLLRYAPTAHLTALGASGASGLAAHVGSTMLMVSSHARGVVVVVRTDPDSGGRVRSQGPVVVGVDCAAAGEAALGAAFEEAAERDAELVAVHVWNDMNLGQYAGEPDMLFPVPEVEVTEQALVAERLAGWQEKYPEVLVDRRVYPTGPAETLLAWSRSAQLLVVGSRGRGALRSLLLGSTSNALVQHAQCPVMVVHSSTSPQQRSAVRNYP